MKRSLFTVVAIIIALTTHADYSVWTNTSGQPAELKLLEVEYLNGEMVGHFRMRNGQKVTVKHSDLSAEDGLRLRSWTPPMSGESSVFDDILWGNLQSLKGESLEKAIFSSKPKEYYVFYYTASWCGPCKRFTPSLVDWYNDNKNGNFEIFLISSDRSQQAMEGYAKKNKMPWPHLYFDKVKEFKTDFRSKHGVRGIPTLIVCDADGKVLGNYRSRLDTLSKMVK